MKPRTSFIEIVTINVIPWNYLGKNNFYVNYNFIENVYLLNVGLNIFLYATYCWMFTTEYKNDHN